MSQIKFDVTGTLDGNVVSVGCQRFTLAQALGAAEKVEIEGTMVRATGVVCEVTMRDNIHLPNGAVVGRLTLREQARNITDVTPPAPPQPEWQDGDVAWIHFGGRTQKLAYRFSGKWFTADNFVAADRYDVRSTTRWSDGDAWTRQDFFGCKPVVKGGKPVDESSIPGAPFRVGQRVRLITNIGGEGGYAGQHGTLELTPDGRYLGFRPDGYTTGGGLGYGLYSMKSTRRTLTNDMGYPLADVVAAL